MADPFSFRTYLGDGTNAVFSVPFPYLEKAHVHVYVDGVETAGFQWLSSNSIRLTATPGSGVKVKIARLTPKDARAVNFQNGTNFVEADLDKSADQAFYIVQEAYDSLTTQIQQDNTGKWNALGKVLTNLGDPVEDQDAATKKWVLSVPNTTLAASLAAQEAAEAAATAAQEAAEAAATAATANVAQATAVIQALSPRVDAVEQVNTTQDVHIQELLDGQVSVAASVLALQTQLANASSIGESIFLHSNCGGF